MIGPLQQLQRRIEILEAQVQSLTEQTRAAYRGSSTVNKSTTTVLGNLASSLKLIFNLGFAWTGNRVSVKEANGITVGAGGVGVKARTSYGITVSADGVALKKQATVSAPAATTLVVVNAGADAVSLADLNTKLATLRTEINAIATAVGTVITRLQAAEVIS